MQTLVLVIHLLLAIALIAIVLMQRSEGGALGIGGGTPFMGARAAANALTRATAVLAGCFMLTSVALTMMARHADAPRSILDAAPATAPEGSGGVPVQPGPTSVPGAQQGTSPAQTAPAPAPQTGVPPQQAPSAPVSE